MKNEGYYLGIDVGSVSTNLVLTDGEGAVKHKLYLRTCGRPIDVLAAGLRRLGGESGNPPIAGAGATGSGRQLAAVIAGADVVKNEITAHAVAAQRVEPQVRTVLEIGGQDSKIIFLEDGVVTDFAMNTVCAAGTGSFLDRQAARIGIPIEEFGAYALRSAAPTRIAGRCAVFAESDMIHKQQTGHCEEDIICGLCEALVRNYLSNLARGRKIEGPVLFQGGVAANRGIVRAFERELGLKVTVPAYHDVMGAWGAALLAAERMRASGGQTAFLGFENAERSFENRGFDCEGCSNRCEVVELRSDGEVVARWGDRCGKWSDAAAREAASRKVASRAAVS
jgi:predicted CoA-substrate-specific enzyme activase